ncbi:hypothetical protein [Listeria seeligeri]|uniref:hypothetical protein n=1 Tax=Listeria seeligeri TaxID=1640 RepID=UPI001629FE04|nr:hypothetical protein [Listeria seeligeri]MBC1753425.1 hypothetical protein [Listeria seeligeri]MBC1786972.1 hypothetical protein [Listeria seeligeri]MBC1823682.1 hypothetical protein [Listeria seeligeri]MBC1837456.1 hypothetical protein [Listeria seeligeri]MBC2233907.1 hypothetical protein [Listeria seeligeri]
MRKIIYILIICCYTLVGCGTDKHVMYESKQFEYGSVIKVDSEKSDMLQIIKNKPYLVSEVYFPKNDLEGEIKFREVTNDFKIDKSETLKIPKLDSTVVLLSPFSYNSNPTSEIALFKSGNDIGIVSGPNKYIPITKEIGAKNGRFTGTGTFSNDENVIMFYNQEDEKNTLTYWNKKGKMNKEILLNNIIEDKQISVDDMAVFHDDIYIYSYKSQKIYIISQNLELIDTLEIGDGLKNIPPEKWGSSVQFVLQRELGELFLYNSDKPEQGFYRISDTGLERLEYGQAKYKNKFILANGNFYDLYKERVISNNNDEVKQMVLNTDGNYYFTTSKDLSDPKKKVDEKNIYLTKINKKSLPAYIEELNEKNN